MGPHRGKWIKLRKECMGGSEDDAHHHDQDSHDGGRLMGED